MDFFNALERTFTNVNIVSAITSTVFIILIGYAMRKRGIFTDTFAKTLTKVVLSVALPALAFTSFMQPIDPKTLSQSTNVLIWGIIMYIVLIFVMNPFFAMYKTKGDRQMTLKVLSIFGSTTFFGLPIVGAVWGAKGILYGSIFNIGYRIFLYSYAYIKMSGLKMEASNIKKMFLNPIVIATFAGLILWLVQGFVPTVAVTDLAGKMQNVAFYRIDLTAMWLMKPLTYLSGLASPLAWLAIGSTLGSISFAQAFSDKTSWYYTLIKIIVVPIINIILLTILSMTHILPVDQTALSVIVIMMATPPATVAVSYAISFDREALLASNTSLLATLGAVVMTPVWIVVLNIIAHTGLFN
ncbi:AEC family transporter [Leuconostoc inhae]|uniref:AEC family transporter n=1 Tax=Leuconostoc inhae TaxID=178001 RepID=UPI001C7D478E|nr:AEC family transporter [Leuconostoc inhae]